MEVTTIGLDIAKNVFQVHGVDAGGKAFIRKQPRRRRVLPFFEKLPPCLVGIEACTTAHHWGRQLIGLGHEVKLMPPRYVKPYVKRNKNDMADAEAICEAVTRPSAHRTVIAFPAIWAPACRSPAYLSILRQDSASHRKSGRIASSEGLFEVI